jgi:hypothetical protein
MKHLFCVVVTDPDWVIGGLDPPMIFHVECENKKGAKSFVIGKLSIDNYKRDIKLLNICCIQVTDSKIVKL